MIRIGLDRDGAVCSWNSGAEAMSGFRRDKVIGKCFVDDLLDAEDRQAFAKPLGHARTGQPTPHIDVPFRTAAVERVDLSLFAVHCKRGAEEGLAPDAECTVLGGGLLTEDAPRRVSVDRKGCILDWGDEVALATGFGPGEVLGADFVRDIVTRDLRNFVFQKLCQALLGEPVPAFELPVFAKDGMMKTFEVRVAPNRATDKIMGTTFILTETVDEGIDVNDEKVMTKVMTSETSSAGVSSASSGSTQDRLISYVHLSQDSIISEDP